MVINSTLIYAMEDLSLSENVGSCKKGTFSDLIEEKGCCESSSSSDLLSSENIGNEEEHSQSSSTDEDSSSPPSCNSPHGSEDGKKKHLVEKEFVKQVSALPGINH